MMLRNLAKLRITLAVTILFGGAALLAGQDWQSATALPGIDFTGLTAAQKESVLRVMRAQNCSCGCTMRLAECRVKDPSCSYSRGMAEIIIDAIKSGKTEQQAYDAAKASRWGHVPEPKLLDDPVAIPIAGAPATGPTNAKITIVEFSDFQCPYCVLAVPELQAVLKAYPNNARLIFKEYPLQIHSSAFIAAAAAVAAQDQGKFWPMYDALFDNHNRLDRPTFIKIAQNLGLDIPRFEKDMDSDATKKAITKDMDDGDRAGVQGTPTIFINGQRYNGPIQLQYLKPVFDATLNPASKAQTASIH